jgi:peptidoglycan/xylan/chitin deacetylase (PgdA/CDA1 family)
MYFTRTPLAAKVLYPQLIWDIPVKEEIIYLTFDDGPDPVATPRILKILDNYDAKATFFCTGKKAADQSELMEQVEKSGHSLGNHTYSHLKAGWRNKKNYISDVYKCDQIITSGLFRPPYGKINFGLIHELVKTHVIIMWTVLPGDFDNRVSKEQLLQRSIKHTDQGTIIVFHDTQKTLEKLEYALPRYIKHFAELGYRFHPLQSDLFN